jgi:hypothetical protein
MEFLRRLPCSSRIISHLYLHRILPDEDLLLSCSFLAVFHRLSSPAMHPDLFSIAANGHGAPPASICRGVVNKQHLTAPIIAHFQAMPLSVADNHNGVPRNTGQAGPARMRAFPLNAARYDVNLGHCKQIGRMNIDAIDIVLTRGLIQGERIKGSVNGLPKEKRFLIILKRRSDLRAAATGRPEPIGQCFRRRQKVPRLRAAAMPDGGYKVKRQAAGVKSKLIVFWV